MSPVDLPQSEKGKEDTPEDRERLKKALRREIDEVTRVLQEMGKLPPPAEALEEKEKRHEKFQKHLTPAEKYYANKDNYKEVINRESIVDLIHESGVLDEDSAERREEKYKEIWEKIKKIGYFLKYDGSGYYRSLEDDKGLWRNRSATNGTSGTGYREDKVFKFIKSALENYYKLLQVYDDMSQVTQAISELEEQDQIVNREKLEEEANTGDYKTSVKKSGKEKSQENKKNDSKAEKYPRPIGYLSLPGGEGLFPRGMQEKRGEFDYFTVEGSDTSLHNVFFNPGKEALRQADNSPEITLEGMFRIQNKGRLESREENPIRKITVIKPAVVENQDGKWVRKEKGEVHLGELPTEEMPDKKEDNKIEKKTEISSEEIKKGDLVYYMEKELRRWRDPKEIVAIKPVDGESYAKFADDDSLYPLSKIKRAEDIDKRESEYRPGPKDVAPSSEDLESIPDAEKLVEGINVAANEAVKPEKEAEKESQNESINDEVKEKFRDQFNISDPDLRSIPGFVVLSAGQQKLVYKNFSKVTLGRIEEQGLKDYRDDVDESGRFPQLWKGFFSVYYKKKEQSLAGGEILSKGIDLHRGALSDIVKQTRISGLDLNESGALKFISHEEFLEIADENIPKEVELMSRLNSAAEEFSQVSDEWRYSDKFTQAKDSIKKLFGREVDDYREKLKAYKKALADCVDFVTEKHGQEGVRRLMEIDKKVRFTQFFESDNDIDYEEAMQNIKDEPKWYHILNNGVAEKGGYMALGYIGRLASYGLLSVAAVPVAIASAVGIGGVRARKQALEQLDEEAKLRRGGADANLSRATEKLMNGETFEKLQKTDFWSEGKEILKKRKQEQKKTDVINTVSAKSINEKLQNQLEKINSPFTSEEERNNVLETLRLRVRYTRIKMEGGEYQEGSEKGKDGKTHEFFGGLVDYGEAYHRSGQRYELLSTLGEAEATLSVADPDIQSDIDSRLDRYLNYKNDKIKSYVHKKTKRGAVLAGGFAALGSWLGGHWSSDEASQAGVVSPETDSVEAANTGLGGMNDSTGTEDSVLGGAESSGQSDAAPGGEFSVKPDLEEELSAQESDTTRTAAGEARPGPIPDQAEVPKPPILGSQEFVIDEDGEGMIQAIADGLEDKYELSHEKAMEIGNALFIKGEAANAAADDEMYNLVGKGASFKLDFGDLTATDLDNMSIDELVETIDFDNEAGFTAGDSGIKGLELPEQDSIAGDTVTEGYEYDSEVEPDGGFEDGVEKPTEIGEERVKTFQEVNEEAEAVKEPARQEAEVVETTTDTSTSGEEAASEQAAPESATGAESGPNEADSSTAASTPETMDDASVDALREDVIDRAVTQRVNDNIDKLLGSIPPGASGVHNEISVNALNDLNEYMDAHSGQDVVTTIEKLGKDNSRLLLTLEKVVNSENASSGTVLDRLSAFVSNTIKANESRIDAAIGQEGEELGALADAFANAEVSDEANQGLAEQIRGFNQEATQQAEKTGRMEHVGDTLKKTERLANDLERMSGRDDYDGADAFDEGGDLLRDLAGIFKRG
jgi:hypothetical protein